MIQPVWYCLYHSHLILACVFIVVFVFTDGRRIPKFKNKRLSNRTFDGFGSQSLASQSRSSPSFDFLTHSFASKLVQWHLHYCGYNRACDKYSPSVCYKCAPCMCDSQCQGYGDCCPDVIFMRSFNHMIKDNNKNKAIRKQECRGVHVPYWRVEGLNKEHTSEASREKQATSRSSGNRFYMVSQCPSISNRDSKECVENEGLPPVTSSGSESFVYKNIFCARCHGIHTAVPWKVSVSCPVYNNTLSYLSSYSYLIPFIQKGCDVFYSPPQNTTHRQCYSESNMISKCNQTGQWRTHDSFLARACGSYLTPKVAEGNVYKNVFCYMCNKKDNSFDPELDKCREDPFRVETAFEGDMDYKQLNRVDEMQEFLHTTEHEFCGEHGLYDPVDRRCRRVSCTFGQRLDSRTGSCQPAFVHVKGLQYELYFQLKHKVPSQFSGEYDYIGRLPSDVEIRLRKKLKKTNVKIEDLSVSFNMSTDQGSCSHSTINGIVLYARIKCVKSTNQTRLQQILLSLRRHEFHIVSYRWNVSLESFPVTIPWYLVNPSGQHLRHFSTHCLKINSKNLMRRRQDGIIRVGTTTPDPVQEHARLTSPPVIRVSKLLTCPQVRLLPSEYVTLKADGDKLQIPWQREMLSEDDFFRDLDGTVSVCLSTFLIKLNRNSQRRTSAEILCSMMLLPISAVLLVICFIILILPPMRSLPRKNNMVVIFSLALCQTAICVGYNVPYYSQWCTAMGILAHYFSLCLFVALVVSSYHLYKVFNTMHLSVDITQDCKTFSKYCCLVMVLPLVVVTIVIAISKSLDRTHSQIGYGSVALCFMTSPTAMWLALYIPLIISVAICLLMYLLTYSAISNNADLETDESDERHVHFYFRSSLFVFFVWTLAAIAFQTSLPAMRTAFVIAQFCLGLYISIILVLNKNVLGFIWTGCCSQRSSRKNGSSIIQLDNLKLNGPSTDQYPVITTSYKQRDSPKSLGRSVDGYSTDFDFFGDEENGSRVIHDGYSTIETLM